MGRIIFTLTFLLAVFNICAQSNSKARSVLDKTASVIHNAGDIEAKFSATSSGGSMTGTVYLHKNMLHLNSANAKCWYDGKTLWTYQKQTNEVNITTPTPAEQQNINPYLFINIYKKGYSYTLRETILRGKSCYEVTLTATSASAKLRKMVITIDKSNSYPLAVDIQRAKSNTHIDILSCKTKQTFSANTFVFPASEYKSAEIIDLR